MRRVLIVVTALLLSAYSADAAQLALPDSVRETPKKQDTAGFKMTRDPWLAFGLSAVIPGAGQVYLGQWYKAPFIVAGVGGCIVAALVQNNRYHYIADSVTNQLARGDNYNASRYTSVREFYRDDRDRWYIYAGLVYVANLLDAYIAANLYDFDVSDPSAHPYLSAPSSREEPWRLGVRIGF
jgi:hypothetical protein